MQPPEFHSISESPSEGASMSSMQSRDANQLADLRIHRTAKKKLLLNHLANRAARVVAWKQLALGLCSALAISTGFAGCNSLRGPAQANHGLPNSNFTSQAYSNARSTHANTKQTPVAQRLSDASTAAVVPVSYQEPLSSTCQTCNDSTCNAPNCGAGSTSGPESCGPSYCVGGANQSITDVQEYVFDGGDLDPALLVRNDRSIAGLNPTDTVAYYETYDGKLCVTPTNRVPIYAPRFGAIRQVTGIIQSEHAQGTERILAPISPSNFEDRSLASSVVKPEAPHGEESVSLIDAFRDANLGVPIAQVIPPQRMSDAIVPFEAIDFFRTGILKNEDIPVLGQFLQNAKTWETPESLEVLIDGQEASIVRDTKQAQDVHVYEMPPGKCTLRICKAASHMIANSGDQISFTIRFDNIGIHPIEKVTVVDSLSPRLEYIEDSQQCSVAPAPEFTTEPNDVGSAVLKWEFSAPLKPGEGGVIHFRCLVR